MERSSRGCWALCLLPKRGRSAAFANPALNALQAHHVWLPKLGPPPFAATALHVSAGSGEASVFVAALPGLEHILIDARGRQHVVLRANGAALQLMVEGADVVAGPVTLAFLVRGLGLAAIRDAAAHLATLRRILAPRSRPLALPRWTAPSERLRNALIALDGRTVGASYREIAVVLHGIEYVERNWRSGLKERMRRHLQRGLALSGGGYRELLR